MNLLKNNTMKILWVIMLLSYVLGYFFPFLFIIGVGFWIFLTIRVAFFKRQLNNFIRRILVGNYDTGVTEDKWLGDEVTSLNIMINKMVDQLNVFDKLRMEKIGLYYRLIDLISANVGQGIILLDVDRKVMLFNPATQNFLGIEQEKFTFESIENQENNKEFLQLFKDLVENGKVIETCSVDLQLPVRSITKKVCLKMLPLKDREEKVRLAVILATPAEM